MLAVPGIDPIPDFLVRNAAAAVKRDYGPFDAGNLPFIRVEVLVERLGGEEGPGAPSTLRELFQSFVDARVDADGEGRGRHGSGSPSYFYCNWLRFAALLLVPLS